MQRPHWAGSPEAPVPVRGLEDGAAPKALEKPLSKVAWGRRGVWGVGGAVGAGGAVGTGSFHTFLHGLRVKPAAGAAFT